MPSRSRPCNYLHANGEQATIDAIESVLSNHKSKLLKGPNIYVSTDFNQGIDQALLRENHDLLLELCKIDTRGGIFGQKHVHCALKRQVAGEEWTAKCNQVWHMDIVEALELTSYKLRVMCAHVRRLYDTTMDKRRKSSQRNL